MQQGGDLAQLFGCQLGRPAQQAGFQADAVFGDALHTANGDAAVARNVGGLGGPGRERAQARSNDEDRAVLRACIRVTVGQQGSQALLFCRSGCRLGGHQAHETRRDATDLGVDRLQGGLKLLGAEGAEGVAARQRGHVQGHGSGLLE